MANDRLKELEKLCQDYIFLLEDTFHMVDAKTLARHAKYEKWRPFIEDYVSIVCLPEFRECYEIARQQQQNSGETYWASPASSARGSPFSL